MEEENLMNVLKKEKRKILFWVVLGSLIIGTTGGIAETIKQILWSNTKTGEATIFPAIVLLIGVIGMATAFTIYNKKRRKNE